MNIQGIINNLLTFIIEFILKNTCNLYILCSIVSIILIK